MQRVHLALTIGCTLYEGQKRKEKKRLKRRVKRKREPHKLGDPRKQNENKMAKDLEGNYTVRYLYCKQYVP